MVAVDWLCCRRCGRQVVQFQYPLHLVSYCADDKLDKRMFTFIAKDKSSEKHHCFVFDSERSVSGWCGVMPG